MSLRTMFLSVAVIAAGALSAAAQIQTQAAPVNPEPGKRVQMGFRTELVDVNPVKGSPFCATVVNEHTQVFADGNKIHTTENSDLCRDSQGRTRRESQLNLLGAVPGAAPKIITIIDPVAGVRYTLDTSSKTARKMTMGPLPDVKGLKGTATQDVLYIATGKPEGELPPPPPGATVVFNKRIVERGATTASEPNGNKEDLGDQTINGIHATGSRMTTVIPAGQMGNEQPINVVSEEWYSPELKATVMTKHTDPWAGTLTTQFTNVNTSEPDPSLFTVPSDYKIVDEKDGPFLIKLKPSTPQ